MTSSKKGNRTIYYIIAGLVVLVGGLFAAKQMGLIGVEKGKMVQVAKAKRVTIVERVSASGKIQPVDEIRISPEVSGEIRELFIKEGDSVKAGQLLARIRPDNLQSALERTVATMNTQKANASQANSRLAQAKSRLAQSELEYARNKGLFEKKVISEQEFQTARGSYEVAKAELESATQGIEAAKFTVQSAEATVKEARENLALTNIYSPIDGIVTKLSVEKGERVVGTLQMAGTEMLRIANLKDMEVRVNVSENDIIRVSMRDSAEIDVDAYSSKGIKFKGVVTAIANSANETVAGISESVTEFEVRILIDAKSYANVMKELGFFPFRPGMTASVDVITDKRDNVLSVPLSAVTARSVKEEKTTPGADQPEGRNTPTVVTNTDASKKELKEVVFLMMGDTVKMVDVKSGISDFDNIEVLSGVEEGQEVVEGPFLLVSKQLKNGDKVQNMAKGKAKDGEKPAQ